VVLLAKLLQRWPGNVFQIARTDLFSLHPEISHELARPYRARSQIAVVVDFERPVRAYICFS
jgi:hypothetical protein